MFSRRRAAEGSGDPGVQPPDPSTLPRPALWPDPPPGRPARAYSRLAGQDEPPATGPSNLRSAWIAVALMVLGAVLLGTAFAVQSPWPAVLGVVVGSAGLVVGYRAGIMETVE